MKDETAYKKVIKARADLVMEQPFFASLALRLNIKEDASCPTAWTDGKVFAYNPSYVKILSSEKIKGLCAHTVMHPACEHHTRRQDRDPATWNKACDYVINPILLDAGITLPEGFLYDMAYEGKTADTVYDLLSQGDPQEAEKGQSKEKEESDKTQNEEQSSEESQQETMVKEKPALDDDAEDNVNDPGMSGEVRDGESNDPVHDDTEPDTDWEQAMVQAAANARSMGKLPRGIERLVDSMINPKLCWQEILARFIERNTSSDYTWMMPNRRFIHQGLYLPSLSSQQLNEIAVVIDTSGSIQDHELVQFEAELSAIMAASPMRLHLIYCDLAVTNYKKIELWDLPIRSRPLGGGGTDFRPAFNFVNERKIAPSCLIYLTDLECRHYPASMPTFPVLWVQTGEGAEHTPPFGEHIRLAV